MKSGNGSAGVDSLDGLISELSDHVVLPLDFGLGGVVESADVSDEDRHPESEGFDLAKERNEDKGGKG